ncbi:MAG: hypothetical protein IPP46_04695 [Bacteroidetes bacterium]|nr:hypothetical protein [Bacteroidota bacterium]
MKIAITKKKSLLLKGIISELLVNELNGRPGLIIGMRVMRRVQGIQNNPNRYVQDEAKYIP